MSSVPPNMPPGGGMPPYPPYDPKAQYKAYRAQQKAAWRAQQQAWKAQRQVWKANYVGIYGARVPSLVGPILLVAIGVIAFLVQTGRIAAANFFTWYAHWWPFLLIGAGVVLLGEWMFDMRREVPVRRSSGFVGVLVLLAIVGVCASGWQHAWGPFRAQFGDGNDDFFNAFGAPEHDQDQPLQTAELAANSSIDIQNPRGDVNVAAGDGNTLTVEAHQVAYANSDADAAKIFAGEMTQIYLQKTGTGVLVKTEGHQSGRVNLTITVPKSVHLTVNSGKGDVTVAGVGNGLTINAVHGNTHLNSIGGAVQVHFASSHDRQDFSAHGLEGDLIADGATNDVTLTEIKGRVSMNGEIFGEVHMEKIGGPVNLRTSITNIELASLPGDLTLDSDELRVVEARGTTRVVTHSKDVDLSQIAGDIYVENRAGRIAVEPVGNHSVEAKNNKGDIELTLAPNASANVNGHARNGDILSDFGLAISGDESKAISGRIGSGEARIQLSTENGDLSIKRGSLAPPAPPAAPTAPAAPGAPHLKVPQKQQQQKPVAQ